MSTFITLPKASRGFRGGTGGPAEIQIVQSLTGIVSEETLLGTITEVEELTATL